MIFISAGHHNKDSGAIGCNGKKEADLTKIMRDLTCKKLDEMGVKYTKDNDDETLAQWLKRAVTGPASVTLEFHFNAFNGKATGVETLVADGASTNSRLFAKELSDITVFVTGLPNRGVKTESESHRGRLGLMRELGIVALIELAFIDNCGDVDKWDRNKELLASHYAKILSKYENKI